MYEEEEEDKLFYKDANKERIHKRQRFTKEEDMLLTRYVNEYGYKWDLIATKLNHKTKRQVKDRWMFYLNPELKAEPYTKDEDELLEKKLIELGNKWRVIVKFFPGRTDVSLKNRWSMIKRQRSGHSKKTQRRRKITPQSSGPAPIFKNSDEFFKDISFDIFNWDELTFDHF